MQILRDYNDMRAKHRETTDRERQQLFEYLVTITTKNLHVHPYNIYTKIYKNRATTTTERIKRVLSFMQIFLVNMQILPFYTYNIYKIYVKAVTKNIIN